ncbi:MAG: tripartite tricarboxylate transporter substrate binding protein [Betaproteobacteria bacterium]|nr:tripartite tricarboxylate transporter substrate binding protein [Betaproteobacteria bacterium]
MTTRLRIACALALTAFAVPAAAQSPQNYPAKPVRLVVPFPPGGGADNLARMLVDKFTQRLGQQVIIDNRGGANGNIGMGIVAKAPADGYTLVITSVGTWAVNPSLYKLPFDAIKDFAPIIQISSSPGVLVVHPSLPVKNVKELVALAKAQPGKLDYGSAGIGGFGHISAAVFTLMTGTRMVHIPYKGAGPALMDLLAGQIQVLFNDATATMPHIKSGRMRALAVTSIKRMQALSELPTIDEAGVKGYDNSAWMAIAAPAGTPREIITRLNSDLSAILRLPEIQEKSVALGAVIIGGTPEQLADFVKSEIAKFARVVRDAKITAE